MQSSKIFFLIAMISLVSLLSISCRKNDQVDTSPSLKLAFSTDTVFFDTVFPTVGSVTQRLVVYNQHKTKISISSIRLSGGSASAYRLNINGTPATSASNIEIPAEDSIYIFVRVTVDPQNENIPFVVSDSLEFITNTNVQHVRLVAWGREAEFYRSKNLTGNIIWDSLRAHVIYDSLRIDTNSSLTILPGARVYFHKDAKMNISFGSSLKINGTLDHPVRFQGDRMDPFYKDLPGQWSGIYLERGSIDHEVTHAIVKNGVFGFSVDSLGANSRPMLKVSNTIIQNMSSVGIYAYGTSIEGVNCVIGDCGGPCLSLNYGGLYDFRYLTVANYWYASVRRSPSLYLSNFSYNGQGTKVMNPLTAAFTNAIVYGSEDDEIQMDSVAAVKFEFTFDHALLKTRHKTTDPSRYINCMVNKDPEFVNISELNYQIDSISPAIGKGKDLGIPFDIRGNTRSITPALGAYEYVKKN